jgi:subtilase family serine protease
MRNFTPPRPAHVRRLIAGMSAFGLALAGLSATAAADPSARTSFPGSVPSLTSTATDTGTTSAANIVEGTVYLDLKDELGAQQFAIAVSTPRNPQYRQFLSPADWIDRFAPSQADFDAMKAFLQASGFTISAAPASREYIVFRGSAGTASDAFKTSLHNYRVDGTTVSAPSKAPTLPRALAAHVLGVSLGNARAQLTRPLSVRPGQGVGGAAASSRKKIIGGATVKSSGAVQAHSNSSTTSDQCSSYYGQFRGAMPEAYGRTAFPTTLCGYLPSQLRSAGNLNRMINSGYDGSGQTIGIVDPYASPTIVQDTNDYMLRVRSPLLTKFTQIGATPSEFTDVATCHGLAFWQREESLDVQAAHSVAPGASILYSGAFNCAGGMDIALSQILDNGLADIVSNSYGYTSEAVGDDVIRGQQNIHLQAAGEGIGLYFGSGDTGDNSTALGTPSANWPATSPFVTSVGGTSEAIRADGSYRFEVGWGDIADQVIDGAYTSDLPGNIYNGGAGGGTSRVIAEPAYQRGVVPESLSGSGSSASRVEPDIADVADQYTAFMVAIRPIVNDSTMETGPLTFGPIGGTSLSTPVAAAKMALVEQQIGTRIGFANPALYRQARRHPSAFHDVVPRGIKAMSYLSPTTGNRYLITQDQGLSLQTAPGYDNLTGIGSLKVPELAKHMKNSIKLVPTFRSGG